MTEPTKRSGVLKMKTDDLIQTIESNAREELLAASAQSAEPREAEEVLRRYIKGNSPIDWDRIKPLIDAYAVARLASKPSLENTTDADALEGIANNMRGEGVHRWYEELSAIADRLRARPSREEELREALEEFLKRMKCWYEILKPNNRPAWIGPAIDRAEAALAQGGARDEGEGKR